MTLEVEVPNCTELLMAGCFLLPRDRAWTLGVSSSASTPITLKQLFVLGLSHPTYVDLGLGLGAWWGLVRGLGENGEPGQVPHLGVVHPLLHVGVHPVLHVRPPWRCGSPEGCSPGSAFNSHSTASGCDGAHPWGAPIGSHFRVCFGFARGPAGDSNGHGCSPTPPPPHLCALACKWQTALTKQKPKQTHHAAVGCEVCRRWAALCCAKCAHRRDADPPRRDDGGRACWREAAEASEPHAWLEEGVEAMRPPRRFSPLLARQSIVLWYGASGQKVFRISNMIFRI